MNFFTEIDKLSKKYEGNPEHKKIANDYLTFLHTYLNQLKDLAIKKTKERN